MATATAPLLDRPEGAARLNVSLRTFDEHLASGDIAFIKIGRCVRIRASAIEAFIDARESRANPRKKGARP
jgi:excisionase family DNA binding protein